VGEQGSKDYGLFFEGENRGVQRRKRTILPKPFEESARAQTQGPQGFTILLKKKAGNPIQKKRPKSSTEAYDEVLGKMC